MQTIDISTTQNVTINYELAALRDRVLAFLLDQLIIWGFSAVYALVHSIIFGFDSELSLYTYSTVSALFFVFYTVLSEIFMNGQTIGKKALNIKVVSVSGDAAGVSDYVLRWAFRFLDIWLSFGTVASVLISSTDRAQRLGGMLSNTVVIRERPKLSFSLKEILDIESIENYTPKYPQVAKLTDEDMLMVKQVLQRVRKYPNLSHLKALDELVKTAAERLELSEVPKDRVLFLKTMLNDYIVLTR